MSNDPDNAVHGRLDHLHQTSWIKQGEIFHDKRLKTVTKLFPFENSVTNKMNDSDDISNLIPNCFTVSLEQGELHVVFHFIVSNNIKLYS